MAHLKKYKVGFIRKLSKGKGLTDIKKRFLKKYSLFDDLARVHRSGGKIRKEVWLTGRGWVSEAAFRRYLVDTFNRNRIPLPPK